MSDALYQILMILFYVIPLIVLTLNKWMSREFRTLGMSIKSVDLLTPYLILSVHIFSMIAFRFSLFPYFVITVSVIGLSLTCFLIFKKKELYYRKFFRIWWRYVFLIAFLIHLTVGAIAVYHQLNI